MASAEELGPLIRLWGLTTAQLPSADETPDGIAPFLIAVLQEAVPFVDSAAPKRALPESHPGSKYWKQKGSKSFKDSDAKVHITERTISAADLDAICSRVGAPPAVLAHHPDGHPTHAETWVCRRSVHADAAAPGTASWDEFRRCFKEAHAATEDAFTPTVVGAREAATWDCGAVEAEEDGEVWGHFTLKIEEMRHKIGKPLKDRTFPVLQMTCSAMAPSAAGGDAATTQHLEKAEFLVVSITVDDFDRAPGAELSREKGVVVAAYASVERIRRLPGTGEIEWIMATTSDARGVLPQWVQNMAVPGQIAKDVPLFLGWIAREREGNAHPADDHAEEVGAAAVAPNGQHRATAETAGADQAKREIKEQKAAVLAESVPAAAPAVAPAVAPAATPAAEGRTVPKQEQAPTREPAQVEEPKVEKVKVEAPTAEAEPPEAEAEAPKVEAEEAPKVESEETPKAEPAEATPAPDSAPPTEAPAAAEEPVETPVAEVEETSKPPTSATSHEKQEIVTSESTVPVTAEVTAK